MIHYIESKNGKNVLRALSLIIHFITIALSVFVISGCQQRESHLRPGVLTVAQEQQSSWVRNFHPFLPMGVARWGTSAGIYEPLMIFNRMTGDYVPWLSSTAAL